MTDQLGTTAIRAQMDEEAAHQYKRLGATTAMHATILTLCDEVDRLRAENERLQTSIAGAREKARRAGRHNDQAAQQARYRRAEIKGHQRRIARLQAEIERLRRALDAITVAAGKDFWNCGGIARAALAQKEGEK